MARISRADREAIEQYSNLLCQRLRLMDWIVELQDEMPVDSNGDSNPEITAQVRNREVNRCAALRVGDKFFDLTQLADKHRTQTLIHEHLHLHFEHSWHFVENVIDAELSNTSGSQARSTYRVKMELGIDQLAWALTDLLPPFHLPSARSRRR